MVPSTEASRFRAALAMSELGLRLMRQNLRRRHPGASDEEVEAQFRAWLTGRPPDGPGRVRVLRSPK